MPTNKELEKIQKQNALQWLNDLYQRNVGQPFVRGLNTLQEGQQALSRSVSRGASGFLGLDYGRNSPEYLKGVDAAIATDAMSAAALPAVGLPPVPLAKGAGMLAKGISELPEALEALGTVPAMIWNARRVKDSAKLKDLTKQYQGIKDPEQKARFLNELWNKERISLNPVTGELGIVPTGGSKATSDPAASNLRDAIQWPELWALHPEGQGQGIKVKVGSRSDEGADGYFDAFKNKIFASKDSPLASVEDILFHEGTHEFHRYDVQGGNPRQIKQEFLDRPLIEMKKAERIVYTSQADDFFRAMGESPLVMRDENGIPTQEYFDFADDFVEYVKSFEPNASEDNIRAAFDMYVDRMDSGKGPVTEKELAKAIETGRNTLKGYKEFFKKQGVSTSEKNPAEALYENLGGEALAEFTPWYLRMIRDDPELESIDPRMLWDMYLKEGGLGKATPDWKTTFRNYEDTLGGMFPLNPELRSQRMPIPWGREPDKLKNKGLFSRKKP